MQASTKWDKRYCELAQQISTWSKDPSRKIGAVTVGSHGQILSQGYNGFPRGINDSEFRLNTRKVKLELVVHAEMNCIYNACLNGISLNQSTLYVYGLPVCSDCCKGIIQVGINRVVIYTPDRSKLLEDMWNLSFKTTQTLFEESNIDYVWYDEEVVSSWNESR